MTTAYLHRVIEIFISSLRLGLTSFGGPIAHLGYFRREYVERRKWLDERSYAEVVALCQMLPGPASSQVGMSIGMMRAGLPGSVAAWLGFTLPSAFVMIAFAYGVTSFDVAGAGWLHGLKIVAVAVVAQAVWGMSRTLTPDGPRITIAVLAAAAMLVFATAWAQILIIFAAALVGVGLLRSGAAVAGSPVNIPISRRAAVLALVALIVMLIALPLLRQAAASHTVAVFDSFFRVGSLVFGGGHVVMPMLEREFIPPGWVTEEKFVAGYDAVQAVPGPLFAFSAYLGAVMGPTPNGFIGGMLALVAIFLPSFLLVTGALPFWSIFRAHSSFQSALRGINAAVVGILLAALYDPVWTSAILSPADFALAAAGLAMLMLLKLPPWIVVISAAAGGQMISIL